MYFTVTPECDFRPVEKPESVDFIVNPGPGKESCRMSLYRNGQWAGGLAGIFTTPPDEDLPVNNLFLILQKGEDEAEKVLDSIMDAALPDDQQGMLLAIKERDGQSITVPIHSVQRGAESLSFYRQSGHQSL